MPIKPADQPIFLPGNALTILVIVVLVALLVAVLFPLFARRDHPRRPTCQSNIRQQVLAIQIYMQDHDNKFPPTASVWQDASFPPKALICPEYGTNRGNGYGYNAFIGGRKLDEPGMPGAQSIPVIADSKVPSHLLQTRTDIDPRHDGTAFVGFADGHVEQLPLTGIPKLQPETPPAEQNHP
ncbi:MAG: hypothetical protein ACYDCO_09695 [Armatimonadota bacterium]